MPAPLVRSRPIGPPFVDRRRSRHGVRAVGALLIGFALLLGGPTAASARSQAPDGHLLGIDVSRWQGQINWRQVKAAGVHFAIAKATEAQSWVDPQYARNRERAVARGVLLGAYHFAQPDRTHNDAIREADHFVRTAQLLPGHLIPVLDLERTNGLGPRAMVRWTRTWLQRVESHLGVKPMIYVSPSFWVHQMGNSRWFADNGYRLWIAHWWVKEPRVPADNWGGRGWTLWQVSDCGSISGIAGCVDIDYHRGLDMAYLNIANNR
jgi:lysozyme